MHCLVRNVHDLDAPHVRSGREGEHNSGRRAEDTPAASTRLKHPGPAQDEPSTTAGALPGAATWPCRCAGGGQRAGQRAPGRGWPSRASIAFASITRQTLGTVRAHSMMGTERPSTDASPFGSLLLVPSMQESSGSGSLATGGTGQQQSHGGDARAQQGTERDG